MLGGKVLAMQVVNVEIDEKNAASQALRKRSAVQLQQTSTAVEVLNDKPCQSEAENGSDVGCSAIDLGF